MLLNEQIGKGTVMKMITKALVVLGLAVGGVGLAGVGTDAEAKKKNKYDVKVKFCGLVGPSSNFQNLTWFDDNRNIQKEFKNKNMKILVSTFNGKDKLRFTARRIKDFTVGQQRNFKCNEKKGGCRFRVKLTESHTEFSLKVKYDEIKKQRYLYYDAAPYNSGAFKDRNIVIKITKAKGASGVRNWCGPTSRTSTGCKYYFKEWDVSVAPGSSC